MERSDPHSRAVCRQVAELHAANLEAGFLSTLGIGFLTVLYEAIDASEDSVLLVEEQAGRVVGFVSGCGRMAGVYRQLLKKPLRLAGALLPSVWRPRRLWRIVETLRYSRGDASSDDLPDAELMSLAVAPEFRGQGIADRLYERLETYFRSRGVAAFKIMVGEQLAPAHRFYARRGARPAAETEVHSGAKSVIYVHSLD